MKIVCGVSPVRDGSMLALGHRISFDDLDVQLQENDRPTISAMSRPATATAGLLVLYPV